MNFKIVHKEIVKFKKNSEELFPIYKKCYAVFIFIAMKINLAIFDRMQ